MGDWSSSGLWNRHKCFCGLLQENANFYVLTKSWRPSTFFNILELHLSPSPTYMFLHLSPLDPLWPWFWRGLEVLPLPLHAPVKLNRNQKIEQKLEIHNFRQNIMEHHGNLFILVKSQVSLILIDTFLLLQIINQYGCFLKWWYPKMDGENNGKPYEQMDDLGGKLPTIFGPPPVLVASHLAIPVVASPHRSMEDTGQ